MTRRTQAVTETTLASLVDSGAIHTAYIVENETGSFYLVLASGNVDFRLEKKRGGERLFKSLDASANCLRSLGLTRLRVRLQEFKPGHEPDLS